MSSTFPLVNRYLISFFVNFLLLCVLVVVVCFFVCVFDFCSLVVFYVYIMFFCDVCVVRRFRSLVFLLLGGCGLCVFVWYFCLGVYL